MAWLTSLNAGLTGLEVLQIVLQDVNPPDPVKPAFNEVNQAIQEKERLINDAWADYNQTVPNARGEAERVVRAAEGYAVERVNNARGDVARFVNIYDEYRKAPDVDAQAPLPRDPERGAAEDGPEAHHRFVHEGAPAPAESRPREAGGQVMKRLLLAAALVVGLLALWSSVYTIAETEQVDHHAVR